MLTPQNIRLWNSGGQVLGDFGHAPKGTQQVASTTYCWGLSLEGSLAQNQSAGGYHVVTYTAQG